MQSITVLGATGSIGVSTLDVVARHPDRYKVFALTGHSRIELLAEQCRQFVPRYAVVGSEAAAERLKALVADLSTEVLHGDKALADVASDPEVDMVMAAIVGAAGLLPTLAAAERGKRVLLANKESLVMAGDLFMEAVKRGGAELLPIDSEHNAIFQCLPADYRDTERAGVRKILLTGSGGPFRTTDLKELGAMTPDQACAHPNWSMGRKISVDSATMMNKGLELIEACWLFNVGHEHIEVVLHPQSVIHSMVEYVDGSVLAQLGNPDMRTPIAHAMAWPQRMESGVASLDIIATARLDFEMPCLERFPCLKLARQAAEVGGDVPAALNAANEIAVDAFLQNRIRFTQIAEVVDGVLQGWQRNEPNGLAEVQTADANARRLAQQLIVGQE
ncbi:1-deoxy-D-xylulose-5-phosphate reductoisomerase [Porticoccaceae bacterium LTM1]|nr:1-deoxy-D-xylulose-5-phosphate reductoisomerase [Porticoccaceae bacterium LTM1]